VTVLAAPHGGEIPVVRSRYPGELLGLFMRDHLRFFRRLAECGDTVQTRLGRERLVLLTHPDDIQRMLVTEQRSFVKGRALERVKTLLGEGLLTNEGDAHLRQRRLLQPAFHRERIAGYGAVMVQEAERLAGGWTDGATLDVHEAMMRLTRDIAGKTLFNLDVGDDPGGVEQAIALSLKTYRLGVLPFGSLLLLLPLPVLRRAARARAHLNRWLFDTIRRRRCEGKDSGDVLSVLIEARDDAGHGMTDEQVRDEMVTLLLAGHETTAVALSWTWYLLSQHPAIEARLHAEWDAVLQGAPPTAALVGRLVYTRMVLAEAMRLYPPAWILERRAARDVEMGGYAIPAGSLVLASQYLVHRDARWYPAPERFDPERWSPGRDVERPRFSYFPFGAGTRVCIGEQFAWMEGVLLLAAIGRRWRLAHEPTHRVGVEPLVTLRPRSGMRMRLERRSGERRGSTGP
jgi:cytochrome P450